jgi:hypothetical protein
MMETDLLTPDGCMTELTDIQCYNSFHPSIELCPGCTKIAELSCPQSSLNTETLAFAFVSFLASLES